MTPFRVLGVFNGGLATREDFSRKAERHPEGTLHMQRDHDPQQDPPAESFGVDPDVEFLRRQAHERRDAA